MNIEIPNQTIYCLEDQVGFVGLIQHVGDDTTIVNSARTKAHIVTIEAYKRGYRVDNEGHFYNPNREKKTVKLYGAQKYPTCSITFEGKPRTILIHQFAAFCFYGSLLFNKTLVVRHLNGDVLDISKDNIILGTHSQNNLDKPIWKRIAAAKKGRNSQPIIPANRKLTDDQVKEIRIIYKNKGRKKFGHGFIKQLSEQYQVSKTVLHKISKGEYYESVK